MDGTSILKDITEEYVQGGIITVTAWWLAKYVQAGNQTRIRYVTTKGEIMSEEANKTGVL